MGKLTKLKEVFSKENIKKGVRLGVLTASIAFASMGFTSCGDPEIDYCEICEGIQDEYHDHEKEQGGTEPITPKPEPEKELYEPAQVYEIAKMDCCDLDVKIQNFDKEIGIYCPVCGGAKI